MHFIPNPSNTEFIYLVGLEHVVDALTKETKMPPVPPVPFQCYQCNSDFTPVWKWETKGKGRSRFCVVFFNVFKRYYMVVLFLQIKNYVLFVNSV